MRNTNKGAPTQVAAVALALALVGSGCIPLAKTGNRNEERRLAREAKALAPRVERAESALTELEARVDRDRLQTAEKRLYSVFELSKVRTASAAPMAAHQRLFERARVLLEPRLAELEQAGQWGWALQLLGSLEAMCNKAPHCPSYAYGSNGAREEALRDKRRQGREQSAEAAEKAGAWALAWMHRTYLLATRGDAAAEKSRDAARARFLAQLAGKSVELVGQGDAREVVAKVRSGESISGVTLVGRGGDRRVEVALRTEPAKLSQRPSTESQRVVVGQKKGRPPAYERAAERVREAQSGLNSANNDRARQQRSQECSNRSRSASMVKNCSQRLAKIDKDIARAREKVATAQKALAAAPQWTMVEDEREIQVPGTLHLSEQKAWLVVTTTDAGAAPQKTEIPFDVRESNFDTPGVPAHKIPARRGGPPSAAAQRAALIASAASQLRNHLGGDSADCRAVFRERGKGVPAGSMAAFDARLGERLCRADALERRHLIGNDSEDDQIFGFYRPVLAPEGGSGPAPLADWMWKPAATLPLPRR